MKKRKIQKTVEVSIFVFCSVLVAYLFVRGYILTMVDWNYIRGPLAPREYYELGLLDEPIPSGTYLPYTLEATPVPTPAEELSETDREEKSISAQEIIKDITESVDNRE